MKKYLKIFIVFLAISLSASTLCSAEGDYIKNFNKKYSYNQNQFTDVNSEWFASAVQHVYEMGLMNGNSKTTFNPDGNIDNAAVITIAARLHSTYNYGTDEFNTDTSVWYKPYVDYAVSKGMCDSGIDVNAVSTRSFFVGIIGNAIDSRVFQQKNVIDTGALSDVTGWYSNAVYTFYRAGILSGNDEYGTFAPDTPITRAEVAAILSRIVKPSERVSVKLKSRPVGTYSIMEDDGSLEAFKQRALVANFKVLLNGETKSSDWENDKKYIYHFGTAQVPSKTIVIPKKYIDSRYSDIYNMNVITFKNSWVDPNLSGESNIPLYYFEYNLPFQIGGKSYNLSVVNTGGKVDFYGGIIINGDLQLYYPGIAGTESWTEDITYNNYTYEAQNIINSVEFSRPIINEDEVKAYINSIYPEVEFGVNEIYDYLVNGIKIYVGYLAEWENSWYITINKDNMYQPSRREGALDSLTQEEYVFTATEEKTIQWCEKNYGKYVIALVSSDFKSPLMLAEISGYTDSKEEAEIQTWDYTNGILNIEWKKPKISFENPLILIDNEGTSGVSDTSGLTHIVNSGGEWHFNDEREYEYEFFVSISDDEIIIVSDEMYSRDGIPLSRFVKLSLNSTAATVGEIWPHYSSAILDDFDNIITQKKATTPVKPKIINGDVYVPAEFLIKNLY